MINRLVSISCRTFIVIFYLDSVFVIMSAVSSIGCVLIILILLLALLVRVLLPWLIHVLAFAFLLFWKCFINDLFYFLI